jgi:hypothetical protein
MEVISLVHDARMNVASRLIFSAGLFGPNAAWYLNFPVGCEWDMYKQG